MISQELHQRFIRQFNTAPFIVRSPGRINLLGEHTDYNEGFVLPAAINFFAHVAVSKRNDNQVSLYSVEFDEKIEASIHNLQPVSRWSDYILGVVDQLIKHRFPLSGFNLMLTSDIPIGAGLSSSAAVECATAVALNVLFGLGITKLDLALMAQRAEHAFAGTQCGIMDQFASLFGKPNNLIRLDCRTLHYQYIPFDFPDVRIVLFDSGVKHALASSEYNTRRKECEAGVERIKEKYPAVTSLRDATLSMIDECLMNESVLYKRCRYVVEENTRLINACDDLAMGNIGSFGKKMKETHAGLSGLYEVSCPELDFLVDQVSDDPHVYGARMMGGGFGGCTINLMKAGQAEEITQRVASAYHKATGKMLAVYPVEVKEGTTVVQR
ncbi:MAG: galactokinase [Cyclobacteriaceae bacterium]